MKRSTYLVTKIMKAKDGYSDDLWNKPLSTF